MHPCYSGAGTPFMYLHGVCWKGQRAQLQCQGHMCCRSNPLLSGLTLVNCVGGWLADRLCMYMYALVLDHVRIVELLACGEASTLSGRAPGAAGAAETHVHCVGAWHRCWSTA